MKNGIFRSHISLSVLIQELVPNIVRTDVMNKHNIRKHAGIKIPPKRFWINTKECESASLHVRKKSQSLSTLQDQDLSHKVAVVEPIHIKGYLTNLR